MEKRNQYITDKVPSVGIWDKLKSNRLLSKYVRFIDPPDPVFITTSGRRRIQKLLESLGKNKTCLNIGSGSTRYSKDIVNLDIFPDRNVDVVGNSAYLPFKNESFNIIICQAVLEHVEDPDKSIKEIKRVLRRNGIIYVELPFFQGLHATPTYSDFQRYTIAGIQNIFKEFEQMEKGVLAGPASALAWTLREFLAILFSFNNIYLYRIFNLFFGWLTVPIKYLDYFLEKNRFSFTIASGFFFLGRKEY